MFNVTCDRGFCHTELADSERRRHDKEEVSGVLPRLAKPERSREQANLETSRRLGRPFGGGVILLQMETRVMFENQS